MPIIYLAGPIAGLTYDRATDWRVQLADELWPWFWCLDPMRDKQHLGASAEPLGTRYAAHRLTEDAAIVGRDRFDVARADAVVFNLAIMPEKVSLGTMVELGWATQQGKPVIALLPPLTEGTVYDHPFIRALVDFPCSELSEVAEVVRSLFGLRAAA